MKRNLDRRVETICPVLDEEVQRELGDVLECYQRDNASAWDAGPDGSYVRRQPAEDDERRGQEMIQKLTDKYVKEVDALLEQKEADLMAI